MNENPNNALALKQMMILKMQKINIDKLKQQTAQGNRQIRLFTFSSNHFLFTKYKYVWKHVYDSTFVERLIREIGMNKYFRDRTGIKDIKIAVEFCIEDDMDDYFNVYLQL